MKLRLPVLASLLLALLALEGSAQSRAKPRRPDARAVPQFGSVERTKLLNQARDRAGNSSVLRYGSIQRRALLTGKSVHVPRAPRRTYRVR